MHYNSQTNVMTKTEVEKSMKNVANLKTEFCIFFKVNLEKDRLFSKSLSRQVENYLEKI